MEDFQTTFQSSENPLTAFENLIVEMNESNTPIAVVCGNLGRYPHVLTRILSQINLDNVGIVCRWNAKSKYQLKNRDGTLLQYSSFDDEAITTPSIKLLIVIEPYFGQSFTKMPEDVEKIIILTSHFKISISIEPFLVKYIGIGSNDLQFEYDNRLEDDETVRFKPPVFVNERWQTLRGSKFKNGVCFNVTKCQSADESFLRLLTGFEMLKDFTSQFAVLMSPRDRAHLNKLLPKDLIAQVYSPVVLTALEE